MNIYAILSPIVFVILSFFLLKRSEKKENERIYALFKEGVILREYQIIGHAFKKERLIQESVVLDRKGKYVLLQCGDNEPYEENINSIINYSDKAELIWDGEVIATFGINL